MVFLKDGSVNELAKRTSSKLSVVHRNIEQKDLRKGTFRITGSHE